MHIGQKILKDIQPTLGDKYSININENDWELFKEPLLIEHDGRINRYAFEARQEKSIDIIETILDIHGKAGIVKFLGNLVILEPRIQELQPWVRDHVVHAINTFILGVYILDKITFPQNRSTRFDYPFIWKLCGLTHDLGYPIEIAHNIAITFYNEVNHIISSISSPSPMIVPKLYPQNLDKLCKNWDANEIIQKRITEWALGIDIEDYYGWLRKKRRVDHGVVSALAQLKIVDAWYYEVNPNRENKDIIHNRRNYNQKNFDLDIVSASSALFIHNIDLNYYGFSNKISFDMAPLAFLLFLCDTFQEWDRYSKNKPVYSGNDFDINCTHNSISIFVPEELEQKIYAALYQRLSGLLVRVNGRIAVS